MGGSRNKKDQVILVHGCNVNFSPGGDNSEQNNIQRLDTTQENVLDRPAKANVLYMYYVFRPAYVQHIIIHISILDNSISHNVLVYTIPVGMYMYIPIPIGLLGQLNNLSYNDPRRFLCIVHVLMYIARRLRTYLVSISSQPTRRARSVKRVFFFLLLCTTYYDIVRQPHS